MQEEGHRIFVGNFGDDIGYFDLDATFVEYGPTLSINIPLPQRGFAFISYFRREHAESAIAGMNGKFWGDGQRPLRVEWARGWPRDPSSESEEESESTETSEDDDYHTVFNQTASNNRTVYCGGLTGHITREVIEGMFNAYGEIEEISFFDDRDYAFIRFATKEAAANAICEVNGTLVNGELVRCSWSHRPNYPIVAGDSTSSESSSESSSFSSPAFNDFDTILNQTTEDNCTVYCGGLSGFVTERLIESIFAQYGDIDQISLPPRSRFAFIRFTTKIGATLAICAVNGTQVNGETVRCSWSHNPEAHCPVVEGPAPSATNSQLSGHHTLRSRTLDQEIDSRMLARQIEIASNSLTNAHHSLQSRRLDRRLDMTQDQVGESFVLEGQIDIASDSLSWALQTLRSRRLDRTPGQEIDSRFSARLIQIASNSLSRANHILQSARRLERTLDHQEIRSRLLATPIEIASNSQPSIFDTLRSSLDQELSNMLARQMDNLLPRQPVTSDSSASLPETAAIPANEHGQFLSSTSTASNSLLRQPDSLASLSYAAAYSASLPADESGRHLPSTSTTSNSPPRQPDSLAGLSGAAASLASLPADEPRAAKTKVRSPDLLCKICMDEELGVVFLPCGHLTACARCAQKIYKCPMCRKIIHNKVRTYLS